MLDFYRVMFKQMPICMGSCANAALLDGYEPAGMWPAEARMAGRSTWREWEREGRGAGAARQGGCAGGAALPGCRPGAATVRAVFRSVAVLRRPAGVDRPADAAAVRCEGACDGGTNEGLDSVVDVASACRGLCQSRRCAGAGTVWTGRGSAAGCGGRLGALDCGRNRRGRAGREAVVRDEGCGDSVHLGWERAVGVGGGVSERNCVEGDHRSQGAGVRGEVGEPCDGGAVHEVGERRASHRMLPG